MLFLSFSTWATQSHVLHEPWIHRGWTTTDWIMASVLWVIWFQKPVQLVTLHLTGEFKQKTRTHKVKWAKAWKETRNQRPWQSAKEICAVGTIWAREENTDEGWGRDRSGKLSEVVTLCVGISQEISLSTLLPCPYSCWFLSDRPCLLRPWELSEGVFNGMGLRAQPKFPKNILFPAWTGRARRENQAAQPGAFKPALVFDHL